MSELAFDATVRVPGSKSITNRALVCAALAEGRSTLRGALDADDTQAMIGCLRALGVEIEEDWSTATLTVHGGALRPGPAEVDARQSGTTARFVAPVLALGSGAYRLTGHAQLLARPMGPMLDGLRSLGVDVREEGAAGHLPVVVDAPGSLAGGTLRQPGHVSSQFLSGLLLAAPLLTDGLTVELTSELVSRPYVELTASVMGAFGVEVSAGGSTFAVEPGRYRPTTFDVEPDASGASYFFAAAAVCGGRVRVEGLGRRSAQGDVGFVAVLARMGANVEVGDDATEVRGGALHGVEVDMADISDTAPTLAVVAAFADSPTRVTGIGFIRAKESDRIGAVVTELRRMGVDAEEEPDGFVVRPDPARPPHGARIETYDDHRMAMSFAVAGLRVPSVALADPGCVAKTFPTFFEVLDTLR